MAHAFLLTFNSFGVFESFAFRIVSLNMTKELGEMYREQIKEAVGFFWDTRNKQTKLKKKADQGSRSSVTAGKHLDGFIQILTSVAIELGLPEANIHTKRSTLPGYFRPSKDWDLIVLGGDGELLAAVELKSQVGSIANNFNNRTEEAIGNAVDLWTSYREGSFSQVLPPWLGYFILVEKSAQSTAAVRLKQPHFSARAEFQNTSYLQRYDLLCAKLMKEKHYNFASMLWTTANSDFGCLSAQLSFESFLWA